MSGEDHNIHIYYPSNFGGGVKMLFRKRGDQSSQYNAKHPGSVRREGSYIYEAFLTTGEPPPKACRFWQTRPPRYWRKVQWGRAVAMGAFWSCSSVYMQRCAIATFRVLALSTVREDTSKSRRFWHPQRPCRAYCHSPIVRPGRGTCSMLL